MDHFSGQFIGTLLALAFVCLLAWGCIAVMRRLMLGRIGDRRRVGAGELRFVRALPIGPKERVVVVQYRGEDWLLGVAAGSVHVLARHGAAVPAEDPGRDGPTRPDASA